MPLVLSHVVMTTRGSFRLFVWNSEGSKIVPNNFSSPEGWLKAMTIERQKTRVSQLLGLLRLKLSAKKMSLSTEDNNRTLG